MTEMRTLLLSLAPDIWSNPLDATAGLLLDIAAERTLRAGAESTAACGPGGALFFVGDDVRNRVDGRIAALPTETLDALEHFTLALHDSVAGGLYIGRGRAIE